MTFFSATPILHQQVLRCDKEILLPQEDSLAQEVAVALVYNALSHAVMMCSPTHLEDFALGFSLSEGIIAKQEELYGIDLYEQTQGIEVHIELASAHFAILKERRRQMAGRTGCGLCGVESLNQAIRPLAHVTQEETITPAAIELAQNALMQEQPIATLTGCTHAATWCTREGKISLLREDVGRHVALDKLIGAREKKGREEGFALISSRASYEMVHKAAQAGIEILVAVSAPTALAVQLATEAGITLIGFARSQRFVIYSHPKRVISRESPL